MATTLLMAWKQAEADGWRVAYWDACSKITPDPWGNGCDSNIARKAFCEEFHGPWLVSERVRSIEEDCAHQYTHVGDRIWCTWYDGSRSEIIYSLRR